MNPCEYVSFITAISCMIVQCVPKEEIPLLAATLGQIASTLGTMTVYQTIENPPKTPNEACIVDRKNLPAESPTETREYTPEESSLNLPVPVNTPVDVIPNTSIIF